MARTHAGEFVLYVRAGTITAWCFQLSYLYSQLVEHTCHAYCCTLLPVVPRFCHVGASDHARSFVACVLTVVTCVLLHDAIIQDAEMAVLESQLWLAAYHLCADRDSETDAASD